MSRKGMLAVALPALAIGAALLYFGAQAEEDDEEKEEAVEPTIKAARAIAPPPPPPPAAPAVPAPGAEDALPRDSEGGNTAHSDADREGDALPRDSEGGSTALFQADKEGGATTAKKKQARTVVKPAGPGKGRGLFLAARGRGATPGEVVVCVRPALTLLFEPFCATHCLGCFADLHAVPGRQCLPDGGGCGRFAVCQACDEAFGLFDWHARGECRRWQSLPVAVRSQQKIDVLWMLVRYRAALDEEPDFSDLTAARRAATREEFEDAVAAAAEAGAKEAVADLKELQGNSNVALDEQQLGAFARLTCLPPATVKELILRLRTNGGGIHDPEGRQVGMALSTHLAALNHSCAPNAGARVAAGHVIIGTLAAVAPGEELTICYVDAALSREARRAVLKAHYAFDCACPRCEKEEEGAETGEGSQPTEERTVASDDDDGDDDLPDLVEFESAPDTLTSEAEGS